MEKEYFELDTFNTIIMRREDLITETDWNKFPRDLQIDFLIEKKLFDDEITTNELIAWCNRHAFEKNIKDPILNKNLNYPFSFTGRWVLALITMWHLHNIDQKEYVHYRREIMPEINKLFKKSYDITNIATLARKPYELIEAADKVRLGEDYDCDGMWKLNQKGNDVLNSKIKLKVPKTVMFTTFNENIYKIIDCKKTYISWDEAPRLNLKETLAILKTW
jgi:hypothetical protein